MATQTTPEKIEDLDDALALLDDLEMDEVTGSFGCAETSESIDDLLTNLNDLRQAAKTLLAQTEEAIDRLAVGRFGKHK
jgi:hypothetical protein